MHLVSATEVVSPSWLSSSSQLDSLSPFSWTMSASGSPFIVFNTVANIVNFHHVISLVFHYLQSLQIAWLLLFHWGTVERLWHANTIRETAIVLPWGTSSRSCWQFRGHCSAPAWIETRSSFTDAIRRIVQYPVNVRKFVNLRGVSRGHWQFLIWTQ